MGWQRQQRGEGGGRQWIGSDSSDETGDDNGLAATTAMRRGTTTAPARRGERQRLRPERDGSEERGGADVEEEK
ncbi:hypothetical protein Syun_017049 [Stephania yunnanensis]|uniref:Uncharacterized protein n=1 Tax=Stephania yunnanensis TaxID=152371 RepID=A0AAP0J8J5_9MAGN